MISIEKFTKVPKTILVALDGGGLYYVYHNAYWLVTENDELLFYGKNLSSPQCNSQKEIAERFLTKSIDAKLHVEQIEYVFVPRDYEY